MKKKLAESDRLKTPRGKICVLCNRKFIINNQLSGSFKTIDAQNMTLSSLQQVIEKMMARVTDKQAEYEAEMCQQKEQLVLLDPEIGSFEQVTVRYEIELE